MTTVHANQPTPIDWEAAHTEVVKFLGGMWAVDIAYTINYQRPRQNVPIGLDITVDGDATMTFAMLERISQICGTRNINLNYERGWGGSDVTPGDPDSLGFTVRAGEVP